MLVKILITNLLSTILGVIVVEDLVIPHLIVILGRLKLLKGNDVGSQKF